jgi:stage II sporulation protein M
LSIGLQQLAYQKGIPYIKLFCIGILPHGIFEIPAFILSCTLGFYLGLKLFKKLPKLDIKYSLQELSYFLEIYHYNVSPLLLWAGILEIHLTPFLILNFL